MAWRRAGWRRSLHISVFIFIIVGSLLFSSFNVELAIAQSGGDVEFVKLWVDGFDNSRTGWDRYGSSPYLDDVSSFKGLSGFWYRKNITISGSSAGAVTDYVIKLILHFGSGTDSGNNIYLNGHVQADFDDVRFTDADGNLLSYWRESYDSGDKATFWVRVPSIPQSNSIKICLYYDNPSASSLSNGEETFLFFDDFTGSSLNTSKWQYETSYFSVSDGILKCTSSSKEIRSFENFSDVEVRAKWRFSSGGRGHICFRKKYNSVATKRIRDDGYDINFRNPNSDENLRKWKADTLYTLSTASFTYSDDTWYIGFIRGYGSSISGKTTETASLLSASDTDFTSGEIGIGTDLLVTEGTDYIEVDWIFVRPYISPEPSISNISSEEANVIGSWIETMNHAEEIGDFGFQDFTVKGATLVNVSLYIYACSLGPAFACNVEVYLWDGSSWNYIGYYGGAWNWANWNVTDILDSLSKVNGTKLYLKSYNSAEKIVRVDAAYLLVYYNPAIGYSNLQPSDNYISQPTEEINFTVKWTTTSGNLSHYIFSYKIGDGAWTNETYNFPSGVTEAWSNVTKNIDDFSDSEGKWIYWRFYANTTTGLCRATPTRRIYHWETLPPVSRFIDGLGVQAGRKHIFYNGSKPVIYIAYLNTTFEGWMYQIRCFDLESYQWYGPFNVSAPPSPDSHYIPSISVLPDGRLVYMYSYYSDFKFRISTYSADTESNLTKLCSNWSNEHSIPARWHVPSAGGFCYPDPVRFNDTLLVFGRDGSSGSGSWIYYKWVENEYVYSYTCEFTNTTYLGDWETYGSSPYVDEFGMKYLGYLKVVDYNDTEGHIARIGSFQFTEGWAETIDSVAYVEILAKSQAANVSLVWQWNDTKLELSGDTPTWLSWKVTDKSWTDSIAYIEVESQNEYPTTIYCVRLKLKIKGFSPPVAFIYESDKSMYLHYPRRFGDKVIVYGRRQEAGVGRYNHYFVYSDDYGESWKLADGSTVQMPISLDQIKVLDIGGPNAGNCSVWNRGGIIYNGKPIFLALRYKYKVKNWSYPLEIIYYDAELGQSGNWHLVNATYENGSLIWLPSAIFDCHLILDPYYNRPSIWLSTGTSILKLVALPDNFTSYRVIYTDNEYFKGEFRYIADSPEAYEVAGYNGKFLFGYPHIGENEQAMNASYAYGCKFNATRSGYLTRVHVYENPVTQISTDIYIKVALYNASFHLIAVSDEVRWASGATIYAWSYPITFPDPPYIVENETYWLVWKVNKDDLVGYAYTDGSTNQTIEFPNAYTDDFPSQIDTSTATFYNRKISVVASEVRLVVRGLGHDIYPPYPSSIGVNGTAQQGQTVTFHAFWTDGTVLDYAEFYWNASGSMSQNGTIEWTDSPSQAWSNFTRQLPQDAYTISWYIIAYDIYGNVGNTSIQYLSLGIYHLETIYDGFNLQDMNLGNVHSQLQSGMTAIDSQEYALAVTRHEYCSVIALTTKNLEVSLVDIYVYSDGEWLKANLKVEDSWRLTAETHKQIAIVKHEYVSLAWLLSMFAGFTETEAFSTADTQQYKIYGIKHEQLSEQLNVADQTTKKLSIVKNEYASTAELITGQFNAAFQEAINTLESVASTIYGLIQETVTDKTCMQDQQNYKIVKTHHETASLAQIITGYFKSLFQPTIKMQPERHGKLSTVRHEYASLADQISQKLYSLIRQVITDKTAFQDIVSYTRTEVTINWGIIALGFAVLAFVLAVSALTAKRD